MMAFVPISGIIPQYDEQTNWYLKFYKPSTTTPVAMATDSTGGTTLDKCQLDVDGFTTTDGTALFIPFINQSYDAYLFPTAAEADANDTVNAKRVAQNINPFGVEFGLEIKKLAVNVAAGQTVINVPDAPEKLNLIVDLGVLQESKGDYTYDQSSGNITVTEAFSGGESVEVQYGLIAPITTITIDGVASFTTVSQMIASPDLSVGDKVITYLYNKETVCHWQVIAAGTGAGDMSDGTLNLTGSSLQARLQKQPVMSLEQFGAFGDSFQDDTNAFKAAFGYNTKIIANPDSTYLVTDQVIMPNNLDFDGRNCKINWNGTAGSVTLEGRDWGVFQAIGTLGANVDSFALSANLPEFTESTYPTSNDAAFSGKDDTYMLVFAGSTVSNPTSPSFALMPKFISLNGTNQARLDYRLGWTIPSGLTITYRNVTPVHGINIRNFTIEDKSPASGDTSDYASAISLGLAYNCHVSGVTGFKFRNPILFAQYCTDCTSSYGRVEDPQETGGGQGYHTQWSYSLRCDSHKISGYRARHIIDHTKSAYCNVTNCGDTNTADGAYTNHGAYEHDISYRNCIGWHSVGNSGPTFGESCKRIHIENGNGVKLTAGRNIIDLSVYNSRFGFVLANSQGFQADGLTVDDDGTTNTGFNLVSATTALGRTTTSLRPNVIKNSSLAFNSGQALSDGNFTGRTLYVENTEIRKINSSFIQTGSVRMTGGSIAGTTAALSLGSDSSLSMKNVNTNSFGVRHINGAANGFFILDGGIHTNPVITGMYSNRMTANKVTVQIRNVELDGGGSGLIVEMPNGADTQQAFVDISHCTFSNGTITINANYAVAGKLFYTNNLAISSTITVPATAGRILNADNVSV